METWVISEAVLGEIVRTACDLTVYQSKVLSMDLQYIYHRYRVKLTFLGPEYVYTHLLPFKKNPSPLPHAHMQALNLQTKKNIHTTTMATKCPHLVHLLRLYLKLQYHFTIHTSPVFNMPSRGKMLIARRKEFICKKQR